MGIKGRPITRLAGPDCFSKKPDYRGGGQGPSTAEVFAGKGVVLVPGDPTRATKIRRFRERLDVPEEGMKTAADAQVAGQREQRETLQAVGEIHRSAEQHRHDLEMDRQKMIQDRVKGVNDAAQQQHAPPMPVQATSPTIPASPQPYPITPPTE